MAFKYCYFPISYNCHPETCCHFDHPTYGVYQVGPLGYSMGPYNYGPKRTLATFNTQAECEKYLAEHHPVNLGYADPFMRY